MNATTVTSALFQLRNGGPVTVEGVTWTMDPTPLMPGDWYIAQNNTGPKLLTVHAFGFYDMHTESSVTRDTPEHDGIPCSWVIPQEAAYCYDTHQCVKVMPAEGEL